MKLSEPQRNLRNYIITNSAVALGTGTLGGLLGATYHQWEPDERYTLLGMMGIGVAMTVYLGCRIYQVATSTVKKKETLQPAPASQSLEGKVLYLNEKRV